MALKCEYENFLRTKVVTAPVSGFDVSPGEVNPALKDHQRDAVGYLKAEEEKMETPSLFDLVGMR